MERTEWFCIVRRLVNGVSHQEEVGYYPGLSAGDAAERIKGTAFAFNIYEIYVWPTAEDWARKRPSEFARQYVDALAAKRGA